MNFRVNFNSEAKKNLFLLSIFIFSITAIDYFIQERYFYRIEELLKEHTFNIEPQVKTNSEVKQVASSQLSFDPLSPDGSQLIIYYSEPSLDQQIIAVQNLQTEKERIIYSGKRINYPKWLGNEHVFFTTYCGTSCQGFNLVNTVNGEVHTGLLSYMFFVPQRPVFTYFRSWFGEEFEFNGLPDEIMSETYNNKTWLVFKMQDEAGNVIGEKRFLFTGTDLKAS